MELSKYDNSSDKSIQERYRLWSIAIGLQDISILMVSNYLIEAAKENIEGFSIDEVVEKIEKRYEIPIINVRTTEADLVSVRMVKILNDNNFKFDISEFTNMHKYFFKGLSTYAGIFRENVEEKLSAYLLEEKKFSYKNLSIDETITHISMFTSNIWKLRPFIKGSTRITVIFMIRYLKSLGFNINFKLFSECSEQFRDALIESKEGSITLLENFYYHLLMNNE